MLDALKKRFPLLSICGNEVVTSDLLVVHDYDQPVAVVIFASQTSSVCVAKVFRILPQNAGSF